MRWIWGGALCAIAFGGCAHEQAAEESATPVAQNEQQQAPMAQNENWRQPVAGHEATSGVVLQKKGEYSIKQGEFTKPQGEYFQPQGIYGQKGTLTTRGEVLSKGEYGTWVRSKGTEQRPTGIEAQPQGMYFRPFGSSQMSERQPVAGRDVQYLFVRSDQGRTWQVSDPGIIMRVERKLSDQGCDPGAVDGKADEKFGQALMQCQQKLGLPATGIVDSATARALGIDFESLRAKHEQFRAKNPEPQP